MRLRRVLSSWIPPRGTAPREQTGGHHAGPGTSSTRSSGIRTRWPTRSSGLTTNERTPRTRRLQAEDLRERTHAIYRHLVDWLAEGSEVRIATTFEALGRQRFDEQIPSRSWLRDHPDQTARTRPRQSAQRDRIRHRAALRDRPARRSTASSIARCMRRSPATSSRAASHSATIPPTSGRSSGSRPRRASRSRLTSAAGWRKTGLHLPRRPVQRRTRRLWCVIS